jgi:hypothetical protein
VLLLLLLLNLMLSDITYSHRLKTFSIIFLMITKYTRQEGMKRRDAGQSMRLVAASVAAAAAGSATGGAA